MSFPEPPLFKEKKQVGPVSRIVDELRSHIASSHVDDLNNLLPDLSVLKNLRVSCFEKKVAATDQSHRQCLLVYYKSLCLVENRFPDFCKTVVFNWKDAFKPAVETCQGNIHMEKAAVLFNIGATSHEMGLRCDRNTISGRRDASMEFVAAASAFSYLRQNESSKASVEDCTVDVSKECAGMLESLMLAQAQECICQNLLDNAATTDVVKAKLCSQVSLYYADVLHALNAAPLGDYFEKSWRSYAEFKAALFYAEACLWHGVEDTLYRPARLMDGMSRLTSAVKSAEKDHPFLQEAASSLRERITAFLASYDLTYDRDKKKFPERTLPEIPCFSVIETLRELLEASREKMFGKEFPDYHALIFAKYTEMVDDEIRRSASGEEEDVGEQLQLLERLEKINEDEVLTGDNQAKKRRRTDIEAQRKSIIATAFTAANPTPPTPSASVTALGGGFSEKLSKMEDVLSAQMEVDKNDGAGFLEQVKKVKEEFRKVKEGKENSCESVLSELIAQMITLKTEQEMKIGTSLKVFYEAMVNLDSNISGGSDLSSLLSSVTEASLKEIQSEISSLAALKKERKCYSQESVKTMTFTALLDELVSAYHAKDFYSCEVMLQRVKEMAEVAKLLQNF